MYPLLALFASVGSHEIHLATTRRGRHYLSLLATSSTSSEGLASSSTSVNPLNYPPSDPPGSRSCAVPCGCARETSVIPYASRCIALWEDSHGIWTVFADDGRTEDPCTVQTYWEHLLRSVDPSHGRASTKNKDRLTEEDSVEAQDLSQTAQEGEGPDRSLAAYASAVDVFIQIAEALVSLHRRRLILNCVRPEFFSCHVLPPTGSRPTSSPSVPPHSDALSCSFPGPSTASSPSAASSRSTSTHVPASKINKRRIDIQHFSSVVQLPGFNEGKPIADSHRRLRSPNTSQDLHSTTTSSPRLLSICESPEQGVIWGSQDEEAFLSENLRFIAPELFSSTRGREATEMADVFSLGVLMWELVTGRLIESKNDLLVDIHNHVTARVPCAAEVVMADHIADQTASSDATLTPTVSSKDLSTCPPIRPSLVSHSRSSQSSDKTSSSKSFTSVSSSSSSPEAALTPLFPVPKQLSRIISCCLEKDVDDRYTSMKVLIYDLRQFQSLARSGTPGALEAFEVGAVDRASRFQLSPMLINRADETALLEAAFQEVASHRGSDENTKLLNEVLAEGSKRGDRGIRKPKVLEIWGGSGIGKV